MKQRRFLLWYAASWGAFTLVYAGLLLPETDRTVAAAVRDAVEALVPAALLGLGVWRLSERLPWGRRRTLRFAAVHVIAALVYTAIWSGSTTLQIAVWSTPAALAGYLKRSLGWQLLQGVMVYSVLAGIAYLIQVDRRLSEQRALATRAELQALRAQLNPHFLFNTLHSITALVHNDPAAVEEALLRFSSLLRYVLDANHQASDDVSLEEELRFVHSYLALERLRLGDRLAFSEEIEPDALECVLPALTLQPLVENAVRHGIAPRVGGGLVGLRAALAGDDLVIEVSDDGVGADSQAVERASGLGLRLVRQRLAVRFQRDDMTRVETRPGGGFLVRLTLPATTTPRRPRAVGESWGGQALAQSTVTSVTS
jgi:two-component sensor histidine kinase/branched-subunit amino acid transport protein